MKKGFTLIELLAVISILALIAVIVFPAINSALQNSRQKAYEDQVRLIEKAAEEWALDNAKNLKTEGDNDPITIDQLVSGGYIAENEVLNPKNDEPMNGDVIVTYESNQFVFDYDEDEDADNADDN